MSYMRVDLGQEHIDYGQSADPPSAEAQTRAAIVRSYVGVRYIDLAVANAWPARAGPLLVSFAG